MFGRAEGVVGIRSWVAAIGFAALAGCGGGSDSGSGTQAPTPPTATGTITTTNAVIELPGIASVDFSAHPELLGTSVTLESAVDETANSIAVLQQAELDVDLRDSTALHIRTQKPPSGSVTIKINVGRLIGQVSASQTPAIYALTLMGDNADGDDSFSHIDSQYEPTTQTLSATLDDVYFQMQAAGVIQATLKAGVASAQDETAAPLSAQRVPSAVSAGPAAATLSIPCPIVTGCIESSMFNKRRVLGGTSRPHFGMDLKASVGTAVYAPAGGKIIRGFTRATYDNCMLSQNSSLKTCLSNGGKTPDTINGRAGVMLVFEYNMNGVAFNLKFIHLDGIADYLIDATDKSLLLTTVAVDASKPVGTTGATGAAAITGAHLHVELYTRSGRVCLKSGACKLVMARIEPFPVIASKLLLAEASGMTMLEKGRNLLLSVSAKDSSSKGVSVSSAVGNPVESPTGDPTRKICFALSPSGSVNLQPSTLNRPSGESCYVWGTSIAGAVADDIRDLSIVARHSSDASVPLDADPLSSNSATIALAKNGRATTGFWEGEATITDCLGTKGGCNPLNINYNIGTGAPIAFRVGSEGLNIRLEQFANPQPAPVWGCAGATASISGTAGSSFTYQLAESPGLPWANVPASNATFSVTSVDQTTMTGTLSVSFDLKFYNGQSGTGVAVGTWTATKRSTSFPKCLPPLYPQGKNGDGRTVAGYIAPYTCPDTSIDYGCSFLPVANEGRPNEWLPP